MEKGFHCINEPVILKIAETVIAFFFDKGFHQLFLGIDSFAVSQGKDFVFELVQSVLHGRKAVEVKGYGVGEVRKLGSVEFRKSLEAQGGCHYSTTARCNLHILYRPV